MYQDIIGHDLTKSLWVQGQVYQGMGSISGKGCLYKSDLMTNKLKLGSEGFHLHKWSTILTLLTIKKGYKKLFSGIGIG